MPGKGLASSLVEIVCQLHRSKIAGLVGLAAFMFCLSGCSDNPTSFLNPAGPIAREHRVSFFLTLGILLFVLVPIFTVLPFFAWRYRRNNTASKYRPEWEFSWPLEIFVWGGPFLIIIVLSIGAWIQTHRLDPYKPVVSPKPPLEIQVVGLDWKWLFIYPEQNMAAVNELVVPVDRPVHISLTSDTVMQSFMIPQLAGQIYAMAGMRTQLNLLADRTGRYEGMNTQYNGTGFAKQKFVTRVVPPGEFARWVSSVKSDTKILDTSSYRQLAEKSVELQPLGFSSVDGRLFQKIIDQYRYMPGLAKRSAANADQQGANR